LADGEARTFELRSLQFEKDFSHFYFALGDNGPVLLNTRKLPAAAIVKEDLRCPRRRDDISSKVRQFALPDCPQTAICSEENRVVSFIADLPKKEITTPRRER
jgi:hypothetical protein